MASNERMQTIARFLRNQIAAVDRPPVGCVQINNDEAAVCAEALESCAAPPRDERQTVEDIRIGSTVIKAGCSMWLVQKRLENSFKYHANHEALGAIPVLQSPAETPCNHDLQSPQKTLRLRRDLGNVWECTTCESRWGFPEKATESALLRVVRDVIDWNTRYPSSRIYSEGEIRGIAKEMDAIFERAKAALASPESVGAIRASDLKEALLWLLFWQNARTKLEDQRWTGRGHAPERVADTIDALCKEHWPADKQS